MRKSKALKLAVRLDAVLNWPLYTNSDFECHKGKMQFNLEKVPKDVLS